MLNKRGGTNWKFLLIAIILSAIVGGGIFGCKQEEDPAVSKIEDPAVRQILGESKAALTNVYSYKMENKFELAGNPGQDLTMINSKEKEFYFRTESSGQVVEYYGANGWFYFKQNNQWIKRQSAANWEKVASIPANWLSLLITVMIKPKLGGEEVINDKTCLLITSDSIDIEKWEYMAKQKDSLSVSVPESAEKVVVKIWIQKENKLLIKTLSSFYDKENKLVGSQGLEFSEYNTPVRVILPKELAEI